MHGGQHGEQVRASLEAMPFVDRDHELAVLHHALTAARAGYGQLLLVGGEPGIGKTRLLSELTQLAAGGRGDGRRPPDAQPRAVWGRCWDSGGAPNMWPWIGVLRELCSERDPDELRDELGSAAPWLAQLVPALRESLAELEDAPALDSDQSRFVLFDALASFLRRAASQRPLVIVLDDIHVADQLSLLALLFVSRQLADMRVLLIGAHREAEVRHNQPLAALFARLAREGRRISLTGLEPEDLGRLVEHRQGVGSRPEVARALHRATGGNPLFTDEVVRMLGEEGRLEVLGGDALSPLPVPMGVRGVIEQRLQALPEATADALRSAAVIGNEFRLRTLAQASGRDSGELLEALDHAVTARLIDVAVGEVGKFRFLHDLIRETAYSSLGPLERVRLHAAVGNALERRYAGVIDSHLEELAHHFLEALPAGDASAALEYAQRAADHALARFAPERAGQFYAAAIEALTIVDDLEDQERSRRRSLLLTGLGRAQLRLADPQGRATLLEAAAAARAAGSPEVLGEVALAFGAFALSPGIVDQELTELIDEALERVPSGDSTLRACLMARLARGLYWSHESERRRSLIDRALAMARRLDDPRALGFVLGNCITASRSPDTGELELGWIDELLSLPHTPGELLVLARSIEIDLLLERGALLAADAAIDSLERQAERLRDVRARPYVWLHRSRRAAMEGRWADAERYLQEAARIAPDIEDSTVPIMIHGGRLSLRINQGRPEEVVEELRRVADALPGMHVWRAALAVLHLGLGNDAEARRVLESLAVDDFAGIARNNNWLITLALLSQVCAELGDRERSRLLYGALLPFAERTVISPVNGFLGPVSRYLGLLSRALGDGQRAWAQLRAALESARKQRMTPMVATIATDLGGTLALSEEPSDVAEASALLAEAERLAAEIGLPRVGERAAVIKSKIGAVPVAGTVPAAPPEVVLATLDREGEVWTFAFAGRITRIRDGKGVRYLAELLAQPGVEVHALELGRTGTLVALADVSRASVATAELGIGQPSGGIGSALDHAAKAAYRRRLEDLREEHDEAERWGDPERASRAREEIGFIANELAAAVGLGGRDRPQSSDAERARVNVTRAIKGAIRRLGEHDPDLGAELEATIHTGLFCRHEADLRRPVRWEVHDR